MSTIKRYPEDVVQDTGTVGITLPTNSLSRKEGLFSTSRTTEEQAISNYINLLLTFKGERFMQPEYGVGLPNYIFEQNTEATRTEIEFVIRQQAAVWLPYIVNHRIEVRGRSEAGVTAGDPENAIQVVITFSVGESGANRQITLFGEGGQVNYQVF
jgi:phage baseplate assembly protein W